jgi:hypothetical protein
LLGAGPALLDRQVGRRRLQYPLARPAAQLGPDMADHLEPSRDLLQDLGHVLAQLGEVRAAAAGADRTRMVHDLLARQMIGQRPAHRLAPFATWPIRSVLCSRRRARCFAFLQILQHQLELPDLAVELLRRAAKLHAPQLGKLDLVLFDAKPGDGQLGLALGQ